jgi:glycosyltransferase involved in cell wall biosynthesis
MPNAILEAMACGLPCIGSDIPGIRDIISDRENGLISKNHDLQCLLQEYIEVKKLRMRHSLCAAKTIQNKFNLHKISAAYLRVFKEISKKHA